MSARYSSSRQTQARSSKTTRHKRQGDGRRRSKEDDCKESGAKSEPRPGTYGKSKNGPDKRRTSGNLSPTLGRKAGNVKTDQSTIRTKTTFVKQLVRETLCEYDETFVESSESFLENRNNRVFLGEFQFEEESECSEVLRDSFGRKQTRTAALKKFRKVVKYVMAAQRMTRRTPNDTRKSSREDAMFLYLGLPDTLPQSDENSDRPLFDLTPFKSIGEKNFSMSVKSVLEVQYTERTEQQVNTMVHMLRTFAKFSSYPHHIQRGICRQGWYARFESAKIICKEGNRAEYYYLILSGVAVSHRTSEDKTRGKTARLLRRGDTIGEKEILTNTEREATIISREPIEVLGIDSDELLNIFRSAGTLDHLDFLRGIPDIQLFPLELLQAYDFSCSAHYYRRGAVIVKNSNDAEWIYIVKTGSCQVYKAIKVTDDLLDDSRKSDHVMIPQMEEGLVLPSIHPALQRVADSERSLTYDNISTKKKIQPLNKTTVSSNSLELPSIKPGQVSMVSSENEWVSEKTEVRRSNSARGKKRRSAKLHSAPDGRKSVYYAKLDIVTEKECFGLQSLLYDDMPGLSLVSNGAECILISKQFFRDNLTSNIVNHLKSLVPPYPNLGKLQDALSHQVKWGSYKQQVLKDSIQ